MNANTTVAEWARQTKERIEAVHKRSIEMLADEMTKTKPNGGRVPVDTGNLARSLLASQQAMPKTSEQPSKGGDVAAMMLLLDPTRPTWLGYQARYARRLNYGFVGADSLGRVYNTEGNYFVEGAVAQWQQIVQKAAADVKQTSK